MPKCTLYKFHKTCNIYLVKLKSKDEIPAQQFSTLFLMSVPSPTMDPVSIVADPLVITSQEVACTFVSTDALLLVHLHFYGEQACRGAPLYK